MKQLANLQANYPDRCHRNEAHAVRVQVIDRPKCTINRNGFIVIWHRICLLKVSDRKKRVCMYIDGYSNGTINMIVPKHGTTNEPVPKDSLQYQQDKFARP